jgi:DNA-binding LytR/AlgR family response regulator
MSLTCVIVDDEYLAINVVRDYAMRLGRLTVLKTFINPEEALAYLSHHAADILFLDIQMPGLSGFELLKKLASPPIVIFTTARHDYAVQAFDLNVLDYLVKPIAFGRFEKAVIKAEEYIAARTQRNPRYIMIRADHRIHKIWVDQIEYIEGLSEYVKIYTPEKTYITLAALKELIHQLPGQDFIRIHKSYIVSKKHIHSFNHQGVILFSKKNLPIGRTFKANFLKAINGTL